MPDPPESSEDYPGEQEFLTRLMAQYDDGWRIDQGIGAHEVIQSIKRFYTPPRPSGARPESVVYGRDKDVIPNLLTVHSPVSDPDILDVTHNRGVMWKGLKYRVTSSDVDAAMSCDLTADCRSVPVPDESYDVVAFDPPHLPAHVASANSSGIEARQYGLNAEGDYRQGDDISDLFVPFLTEAQRILRPKGIVIAKLADFVHNHKYQWSHVDFVVAARTVGMTPCDVIIKADPCASNLKSSKWVNVKHFRRAHAFWIVVRKGRCEA